MNLYKFSLSLVVIFLVSSLYGAYKVGYKYYQWERISTPHFDIYYDKGYEKVALEAAKIAEEAHARYSDILLFELTHVIPVFIYNSHNDFEDTTITFEVLTEGIQGFTEVFKNRIVLPFPGIYSEFRHILSHEIVHAFQYNIFYGDFWESLFLRPFLFSAPLWFMEGMCEYLAYDGIDPATDMVLRDAVLNDMMPSIRELDDIANLPSYKYYFVYKGGQAFFAWFASSFGKKKIGSLLKTYRLTRDINRTFEIVTGKKLDQLDKEWMLYLKKKYLPDIKAQEIWENKFSFVTTHFQDYSFQNVKPVWYSDGRKIIFFTDFAILPRIVMVDTAGLEPRKTLITSGLNVNFEELHSSDNKLSVSYDGKFLCFISKQGAFDRINIYSFNKKRVVRILNPKMDKVFSASFSPSGDDIVFSANNKGQNDLYIINLKNEKIKRLTDDIYADLSPFWAKDGWIYFTSERENPVYSGKTSIWRIHPDFIEKIERVTPSFLDAIMPSLSSDCSKLAFVSKKNGHPNIWIMNLTNRSVFPVTDVTGGAFDPSWSPDGNFIAFSFYNRLGMDIVTLSLDNLTSLTQKLVTVISNPQTVEPLIPPAKNSHKFSGKVSQLPTPDWVNFALAFSDYYGFAGYGEFLFSDITGWHQIAIDTSFLTKTGDLNFDCEYLYQRIRPNIGVGLFNIKNYYMRINPDDLNVEIFSRQQTGGNVGFFYPVNRFLRCDLNLSYINYQRVFDKDSTNNLNAQIFSSTLSINFDNSVWTGNFFTMGNSGQILYEYAIPLNNVFWNYHKIFCDIRSYFTLTRKVSFAFRTVAGTVWGDDADKRPFTVGGLNSVRGFQDKLYTGKSLVIFKSEFRFPFLEYVQFGWPLPFVVKDLSGVLFWDFGSVWDRIDKTSFAYVKNDTLYFDSLKSGLGFGLRLNFFYFKLIFDYATPFDGHSILPLSRWRGFLSLGYDF